MPCRRRYDVLEGRHVTVTVDATRIWDRLAVDRETLAAFCRRWQIERFELFGSVLRDDFRPDSDVDVLVTFAPETHHGLFAFARMEEELSALVCRNVDLLTRGSVERSENWIRRDEILRSAVPLDVAAGPSIA